MLPIQEMVRISGVVKDRLWSLSVLKTSHAFKNINNWPNMLVCFNTQKYNTHYPDVIQNILIQA